MTEPWSPLRSGGRRRENGPARRARGRRRQHLRSSAEDGPGSVLTDADAASAAERARQDRIRPQAPAWERFASVPVSPQRAVRQDASDAVLSLGQARCRNPSCGPLACR